jgi:hypothetical protein
VVSEVPHLSCLFSWLLLPISAYSTPLIKFCSTSKDVSSYVADALKQETKIAEMRASGADESTIKKQEEVCDCCIHLLTFNL